ncbi:myb/SANT-like domain-containing protein [Artemisia annua]|uniref:Myb/SANT-like domain-containing protein n=1 Tax=Artemisia annua TaxID=35608 RepID=A0A2U1MUJ9_ARTAN|nr:myb/SANT-like domain-containing protein [Artemisia annua]
MQKLPTSKKYGATAKREHFTWTTLMDTAFIEAMLKEQDKGNRPNGTFTSEAYTTMAEELSKSLKRDIRKENL